MKINRFTIEDGKRFVYTKCGKKRELSANTWCKLYNTASRKYVWYWGNESLTSWTFLF